jgi:hypothetical protein
MFIFSNFIQFHVLVITFMQFIKGRCIYLNIINHDEKAIGT